MVFYRKYRPQTISELDLNSVRNRLTSILLAKELPHAFLFTGPKGLGKTSSARILAKAINCENRKGIEPCNKCDNCTSITNGFNIDVIEIDAASNRGIDEIRDLREKIKFSPASLKTKVYIIDEVHMLTTDAFNALLKTLEEPPSHAVFVLCTTEEEKVPGTIISRTFHVIFNKPTKEEIEGSLLRIVKGEKLDVEKGVLDKIFDLSEGSFRDAAKIIEDLSFASSGKITLDAVESLYKTGSIEVEIKKLLQALSEKDFKKSMGIIDTLSQKGADFKAVTEKLASVIHDMLMVRAGLNMSDFDIAEFEAADLKYLLNLVNDGYKSIKTSILPQIPLEIVAADWCIGLNQSSIRQVADETQTEDEKTEQPSEPTRQKVREETQDRVETENKEDVKSTKKNDHGALFKDNATSENFFKALIDLVKHDNHSIAGILRGCKLVELGPDSALFETAYKFHRDKLNEAKTIAILNARSSQILKRDIRVKVDMKSK